VKLSVNTGVRSVDKKYAKKGALENHCLMQHQWSLTKNAPASPKTLDDLLTMKKKTKKREGGVKIRTVTKEGSKKSKHQVDATETGSMFGSVSDSSVEISSDESGSVEPAKETTASGEVTPEESRSQHSKAFLTGWSPDPKPPLEGVNPCIRKKLELRIPPTSTKHTAKKADSGPAPEEYVVMPTPGISTMVQAAQTPSGIPSSIAEAGSLIVYTKDWPGRDCVPSVRDIVSFRKTVPINTTPTQMGKIAAQKFGWKKEKAITSEQYVRGVAAGYDHAKREILDEIQALLLDDPKEEAVPQRWGRIKEWARAKERPPTPNQPFDD